MESGKEKGGARIKEAVVQILELHASRGDIQSFFEIIRDSRKLTGVGFGEVSEHIKVDLGTVYRWSKGKHFPQSYAYQPIMQEILELLKKSDGQALKRKRVTKRR